MFEGNDFNSWDGYWCHKGKQLEACSHLPYRPRREEATGVTVTEPSAVSLVIWALMVVCSGATLSLQD